MSTNNVTASVSPLSTLHPDNNTTNHPTNRKPKEREALLLQKLHETATSQLNAHGENSFGDRRLISTSISLDNATATASSSLASPSSTNNASPSHLSPLQHSFINTPMGAHLANRIEARTTTASNRALEGLKKFFLSKEFLYSLAVGVAVVACFYSPLAALVGKIGLLNTLLVGGGVLLGSAVAYRSLLCLASYLKQSKKKAKKIPQTRKLEEVEVPDPKGPQKMFVLHTVNGKKELAEVICTWNPYKNRYVLLDEFHEAEIWKGEVALDEKGTYVEHNGERIYLDGCSSENG